MVSAVSSADFSLNRIIAAAGSASVRPNQPAEAGSVEDARRVEKPYAEIPTEPTGKSELTEEEQQEIEELRNRDQHVRRHEQAHKTAAGQYARGGPNYTYKRGPDNKQYAVEGSVQIDLSEVPGDPDATVRKMQQVRRAALAPADPSAEDRRVAAKADAIANKARTEAAEQRRQEPEGTNPTDRPNGPSGATEAEPSGDAARGAGPHSGSQTAEPENSFALTPEMSAAAQATQAAIQPPPAESSLVAEMSQQHTSPRGGAPQVQIRTLSAANVAGKYIDVKV